MPTVYALELQRFYHQAPSKGAFDATIDVAQRMPAIDAPNLVIIETEDAPGRRMYTNYPGSTEWLRMERTCVMENDGFTFIHIEALH